MFNGHWASIDSTLPFSHQLLVHQTGWVQWQRFLTGIHETLVHGVEQRSPEQQAHRKHHGELAPLNLCGIVRVIGKHTLVLESVIFVDKQAELLNSTQATMMGWQLSVKSQCGVCSYQDDE